MAHPLPAHFRLNDFDAALFTDHAAMAHSFVLAAITFVIFGWPENLGAEKPVAFRLKSSVINRFRLLDFAMGP